MQWLLDIYKGLPWLCASWWSICKSFKWSQILHNAGNCANRHAATWEAPVVKGSLMPNTGNTFVYNYMAACNNCRGCLTQGQNSWARLQVLEHHIADHFKQSSTPNRLNSFCCWALTRLSKISDLTDILRTMIRLVGRHLCCVLSWECRAWLEALCLDSNFGEANRSSIIDLKKKILQQSISYSLVSDLLVQILLSNCPYTFHSKLCPILLTKASPSVSEIHNCFKLPLLNQGNLASI